MVPVIWARPALDDLESIHNYIAEASPRYARLTVERIRNIAELLSRFPEMGERLIELPGSAYRQRVIGNYRLIYRIATAPSQVIVVAVIHASRDLAAAFGDRDPDDG
jgi:toxin ParE1/3/4